MCQIGSRNSEIVPSKQIVGEGNCRIFDDARTFFTAGLTIAMLAIFDCTNLINLIVKL